MKRKIRNSKELPISELLLSKYARNSILWNQVYFLNVFFATCNAIQISRVFFFFFLISFRVSVDSILRRDFILPRIT